MHKVHYNLSAAILAFGLLLGCWNNHIALYMKDDPVPLEVYPVQLDLLPMDDQKILAKGIPVKNSEELHRLLEDYLS